MTSPGSATYASIGWLQPGISTFGSAHSWAVGSLVSPNAPRMSGYGTWGRGTPAVSIQSATPQLHLLVPGLYLPLYFPSPHAVRLLHLSTASPMARRTA